MTKQKNNTSKHKQKFQNEILTEKFTHYFNIFFDHIQ